SVVLPAPLRPTHATISFAPTSRSTSKSTFASPYAALTPCTLRSAAARSRAPSGTRAALRDSVDLPVALPHFGVIEALLVSALGDDASLVHDGEPLQEILDVRDLV